MLVVWIPICIISVAVSIGVMDVVAGSAMVVVSEDKQKSWQVVMEILHRMVELCMMHATLSIIGVTPVGVTIAAPLALDPRLESLEIVTHCRLAEEPQSRVGARQQVALGPPGLVRPLYVLVPNQVVWVQLATPMEEHGSARPLYVLGQHQVVSVLSATRVELGFARRLNVLEQSHHALVPLASIRLGFAQLLLFAQVHNQGVLVLPVLMDSGCVMETTVLEQTVQVVTQMSQMLSALMLTVDLDQVFLVQTLRCIAALILVMV